MSDIHKIISDEIFGTDDETRVEFTKHFSEDIDNFINIITEATKKWKIFDSENKDNKQKAHVSSFFFSAINNIIISFKFLINGHLVPSGSLARIAIESASVAVLCSRSDIQYYDRVKENKYSGTEAIALVLRNTEKLKFNHKATEKLKEARDFYHKYSHPTLLTIATLISFDRRGDIYLGSYFDRGKLRFYQKELNMRLNFAQTLNNLVESIERYAKWRD